MDELPVRAGDLIADKYRVERLLGAGGMGVVVAARHTQLNHRVAVKLLRPEAAQRAEANARFLREAQASVKIQSPHIGRVLDYGTLASGVPYIVMEFLEGCDLAQVLQQSGPLPVPQAIEYVLQTCEALAEAHAAGLVHRDIKPANIFLTRRSDGSPLIKVLDFGVSKIGPVPGALQDASMTATGVVLGSPLYMSPEQVRSSKTVDSRTDVWAVGVVLHELLTAGPVYPAESLPELLAMIAADPPPPLRSLRADVPEAIEAVVLRCLEKQPEARFASVGELARALIDFAPPSARQHAERAIGLTLSSAGAAGMVPLVHAVSNREGAPNGNETRPLKGLGATLSAVASAAWRSSGENVSLLRRTRNVVLVASGVGVALAIALRGNWEHESNAVKLDGAGAGVHLAASAGKLPPAPATTRLAAAKAPTAELSGAFAGPAIVESDSSPAHAAPSRANVAPAASKASHSVADVRSRPRANPKPRPSAPAVIPTVDRAADPF